MIALITILSLVGLASVVFFFTGWLNIVIDTLLCLAYNRHQKIRRNRRPARIFLIRHGESQANVDISLLIRVPDNEIGLTETGHQQATDAGEKLRSIIGKETMYVYMSPYLRSKQTWENMKKAFSPSQIITEREDPRLRELELSTGDDAEKMLKDIEAHRRTRRFFYRFSGGESGADVYDRASLFLDTLFREMDDGHHDRTQNIVIVSHGFFIHLLIMRYFRWTVDCMKTLQKIDNCGMRELIKVDGVYTLDGKTKPPTLSS